MPQTTPAPIARESGDAKTVHEALTALGCVAHHSPRLRCKAIFRADGSFVGDLNAYQVSEMLAAVPGLFSVQVAA